MAVRKCARPYSESTLGTNVATSFVSRDERGEIHFVFYKRISCTCGATLGPPIHVDDFNSGVTPMRPGSSSSLSFKLGDKFKKR